MLSKEKMKKIINANENNYPIYMKNELFELLGNCEELETGDKRKYKYSAEAYCYLYFITYLYRNVKYYDVEEPMNNDLIKQVLGYNKKYEGLNFMIKKDGVLDQLGLTETVKMNEIPFMFNETEDGLEFLTYSEYDPTGDFLREIQSVSNLVKYGNRATAKLPLQGLVDEDGLEGTFFFKENPSAIDNTHKVDIKVFALCMTNKDLGCTAFYIYNYIQYLQGANGGWAEVSLETMSRRLGIGNKARDKALNNLKAHQLIEFIGKNFYIGRKSEGSNQYKVLGAENYSKEKVDFSKRKVIVELEVEEMDFNADVFDN